MKTVEELLLETVQRIEAKVDGDVYRTYDLPQFAKRIGLSERYIRELVRDKKINHVPVGGGSTKAGRILFTEKHAREFLNDNSTAYQIVP